MVIEGSKFNSSPQKHRKRFNSCAETIDSYDTLVCDDEAEWHGY